MIQQLRSFNLAGIAGIFIATRRILLSTSATGDSSTSRFDHAENLARINHTAMNICLFPPLFFFCALYYTDVISVLLVLQAYSTFRDGRPIQSFVFGLLSLTFRQTNIFWTGIFLAGQEIIRRLQKNVSRSGSRPSILDVIQRSWRYNEVYDPPVLEARIEGSLALSAPFHVY